MKRAAPSLTELESHILSIIWRTQPTTAYQVRRAFGQSPTGVLALSQGSVYPAIERLKGKGLVRARRTADRRNTEQLSCTRSGEKAIKAWVENVAFRLTDDPLRNRILSLSILDPDERSAWVQSAKAAVLQDLADVDEFAQSRTDALFELAHDNARMTILARIRWLERVGMMLSRISDEQLEERPAPPAEPRTTRKRAAAR